MWGGIGSPIVAAVCESYRRSSLREVAHRVACLERYSASLGFAARLELNDKLSNLKRMRRNRRSAASRQGLKMVLKEHANPAMAELLASRIRSLEKGVPEDFILGEAGKKGWNLLKGDLPLPLAVLKRSALDGNAKWMRRFSEAFDVRLAPHGKTTMSPQLFAMQIRDGAWGLTAATVDHVRVYRHFGFNRVLMANQLVGYQNISWLLTELADDPSFDFCCLVDSAGGAVLLQNQVATEQPSLRLNVLLELGVVGGRTGIRDDSEALALAHQIATECPNLTLRGIECYEGVLPNTSAEKREALATELFVRVVELAEACLDAGLVTSKTFIVSGGGSEYYDIAARVLGRSAYAERFEKIVRSGCYISQDHSFYARAFARVKERDTHAASLPGKLEPALEVWGLVQSLPEPGLAVLTVGKRDISFDFELPQLTAWFRPGIHRTPEALAEHTIHRLNDQHAYCQVPIGTPLRVGDMVALGIAHPCTTFDKWRNLFIVDDDYNVVEAIRTFF
jgi:D-serine dehydratase